MAFIFLSMRNKVAKRLRRQAEAETIGKSKFITKKVYKKLKAEYKAK